MKDFWKREIMEVIAPVTWVSSLKKVIVEVKRVFFFALAVIGVFYFW